ncbi:50S ribosomal protein L18 [Candidatus Beckwithbacteria bacterium]|nr:50S ribosomal protein L18 [Candidatus Beckwithbacteria bacterium]
MTRLNAIERRIKRVRARIKRENQGKIKLSVHRTNKHIYAQLIELETGKVLASSSDAKIEKGTKTEKALAVGKEIGEKAVAKKIKSVVFDRAAYKYHGRVKAVCEGAREAKLTI